MSTLAHLVARLRQFLHTPPLAPHPDCMSLEDWADLPAYHPRRD